MTGTCDICGDEFKYHERTIADCFIDNLSNRIRIERLVGDRLEIYNAKVCDHCAIRMLQHVKDLTYEARY